MQRVHAAPVLMTLAAAAVVLAAFSCQPAPEPPRAEDSTVLGVSQLLVQEAEIILLGDLPATEGFERLSGLFADGRAGEIELGVYALEELPPAEERVLERAAQLGLETGGEEVADFEDEKAVALQWGETELRVDRHSGAESLIDWARFHRLPGSPEVAPEQDHVDAASAYLASALAEPTDGIDLYPYKLRQYVNVNAEKGGEAAEEVYQVAVAFNTAIDDVPVIGPGSKVAVHMTPAGEVISHEATVRRVGERIGVVRGTEMRSPLEAEATALERLRTRGYETEEYLVQRAEFGYLRRGRSSVQEVVAPYYAFILVPASEEIVGPKIAELVPCSLDAEILELLAQDDSHEQARKETLKVNASEAIEK